MDAIKEIISAYSQRIRIPIFGSIVLAFVAVNWKPIFFLITADVSTTLKFLYWDDNTDWLDLFLLPAFLGIVLAVISPFVSLIGVRIAEWPLEQQRLLTARSAHRVETEKKRLADELVTAAIDASVKQQEGLNQIEGEQEKEDLQRRIKEIKTEFESNFQDKLVNLNISSSELEFRYLLLAAIYNFNAHQISLPISRLYELASNFDPKEIDQVLDVMQKEKIFSNTDTRGLSLTSRGQDYRASLGNQVKYSRMQKIDEFVNEFRRELD